MKSQMEHSREDMTLEALDQILPLDENYARVQRSVALEALRITLVFCAPAILTALVARAYFTGVANMLPFVVLSTVVGACVYVMQDKLSTNILRATVILMWVLGVWFAFFTHGVTSAGPYLLAPAILLAITLSAEKIQKFISPLIIIPILAILPFSVLGFGRRLKDIEDAFHQEQLYWVIPAASIIIATFFMHRIMLVLVGVLRRQDRSARLTFYRSLGAVASLRDYETGSHMRRCAIFARLIAENDTAGPFSGPGRVDLTALELAIPLHDIGKVGIPDAVLLKPGKLTPEEFEIMKRHTLIGWDLIRTLRDQVGMDHDKVLSLAENIAIAHHENWDGSGYPFRLKGQDIPYEARVMAIVDVYDALRSARTYKPGLTHDDALRVMEEIASTKFDPTLYGVFLAQEGEFSRLYDANTEPSEPARRSSPLRVAIERAANATPE